MVLRVSVAALVPILSMGFLLSSVAADLGLEGFVRGSIHPEGAVRAEGQFFIPATQPLLAAWSSDRNAQQDVLHTPRLFVQIDEWRWTSTSPTDHSSTPPSTGVHSHQELERVNATIHVQRAGMANRWFLSALDGGAQVLFASATDCDVRGTRPLPMALRVAAPVPVGPESIAHAVLQVPSTLKLDCRVAGMEVQLPTDASYHLGVYDMRLLLTGLEPGTQDPQALQLSPGAFSQRNASFPGFYDNLVRHVGLQPAPGTPMRQEAHRVSLQSPIIQIDGSLHLPPFEGPLEIGASTLNGSKQPVRLAGNFLAASGGQRESKVGIELAGSTKAQPVVAFASPTRPPELSLMVSLAAGSALALLAVLTWKGKSLLSAALVLFTRITSSRALDHEIRKAIHAYVEANPGVRLHTAYKSMGLNRSTFTHHANSLHQQGLLVIHREGRKVNLFPASLPSEEARRMLVVARDPFTQRLLATLRERSRATQDEIARSLDVSQAYISKRIASLEQRGLVVRRRFPDGTHYEVRAGPDS